MRVLFVMVMFLFFNFLVSSDNNNNNNHTGRQKLTGEVRTKSCTNFPRAFKTQLAETQKSISFGPSIVGMQKISQGDLGFVSKESSLTTNSPRQLPRSRKANSDESDSQGSSSPKSMFQKQSENPERFDQSPPAPPKPRRAQTGQNLPSPNNNK